MSAADLPRIDDEISFRKLAVLLVFLETGNLARTADELGTSTVSVHRALHSLEEGARCVLFRHEGRNLVATPAARLLGDTAREVLGSMSSGLRAARTLAGLADGRIKLGSLYSLTIQLVPEVIVGLRQRSPQIHAELVLGSNAELMSKLRLGTVDATLTAQLDEEPGIDFVPLQQDEMFFAAPLDSPYSGTFEIDLSRCTGERFVSLADGFATQRGSRVAFEKAGFEPTVVMQVSDIFTLANLVGGGIGYSLLPGRVRAYFADKLRFIPLQAPYRVSQSIGLSFLHVRGKDPDVVALTSVCRQVAGLA